VAGAAPVKLLVVDERCPGDRVFEVTARLSDAELAALVPPAAPIGGDDDARHVALLAAEAAAIAGRPRLRLASAPRSCGKAGRMNEEGRGRG
jgi:hypothetical protein